MEVGGAHSVVAEALQGGDLREAVAVIDTPDGTLDRVLRVATSGRGSLSKVAI